MESIFEKYTADIRALLPVHRLFLFVLVAAVSVVSRSAFEGSIAIEVLMIPANMDGAKSLFASALVADFVIAGALVLTAWLIHRWLSRHMISWIWTRLDVDTRLSHEYSAFDRLNLAVELRVAALEFANQEAKRRANISKARAMVAEFSLGVGLCLVVYSLSGSFVDIAIGIVGLVVGLLFQGCSFLYYLRHVLPFELNASALAGFGTRLGMPE